MLVHSDGWLVLGGTMLMRQPRKDARLWTVCGVPDYLAPETIQGFGQSRMTDMWSLTMLASSRWLLIDCFSGTNGIFCSSCWSTRMISVPYPNPSLMTSSNGCSVIRFMPSCWLSVMMPGCCCSCWL